MAPFPTESFAAACRVFLAWAYPDGKVPESRRHFLTLRSDEPLDPLISPPLCQRLIGTRRSDDELRGYAFRLGSHVFPHVKLQVVWHEGLGAWVFGVDTHDAIRLPPDHPDVARMRDLQAKNRRLKQEIEQDWEAQGLLTFNASLRQALSMSS